MRKIIRIPEKGQAIIYLVIGMVVFFGFVALAIDGGMALADRRNAQNVADSASLAGGGNAANLMEDTGVTTANWNCSSNPNILSAINLAESTAISRAAANGFTITDDLLQHNGVSASCGSFDYGWYLDSYIDVTVEISSTSDSNFLQLVYPSALHNEVEAVTRIRPRQPAAFGNAIIALNPATCLGQQNGAIFSGNSNIQVTGGGIFSNGCLSGNGTPTVNVIGAGIYGHYIEGSDLFTPAPQQTTYSIPASAYDAPLPDCSNPNAHNVAQLPQDLEPGLWCLTGDLKINGGVTNGTGVTIYVPNGSVTFNGNASIHLSAPENTAASSPAIPGILFYLPKENSNMVKINGTADSYFIGTILAPGASIQINGTSYTEAYHTQVIGWNVELSGTADTYVTYDDKEQYGLPTSIELAK
jgi:hypothetical protein